MSEEKYMYLQLVITPCNAFVRKHEAYTSTFQKNFLDRVRRRLVDIIKKLNITPMLFLVREYSTGVQAARDKDLLYLHSHVLVAIEKENYNEGLKESFRFDDSFSNTLHYKLKSYRIDERTRVDNLLLFTEYMLKDIYHNVSKPFIDYQFINYPHREEVEEKIRSRTYVEK